MNDRDYFAAHAPYQIPEWFRFDAGNNMPRVPDAPSHWGAAQSTEFLDLKEERSRVVDVSMEVAEFYARWLEARGKHAAWRDQMRERKYFAWRWYYADQMIANRRGSP